MFKSVLELVMKAADKFFPDKGEAQRFKLKVLEMEQAGELKAEENRYSVILAEAQSNDKYVSRARPTMLYLFYFLILWLMFIIPVVTIFNPGLTDVLVQGMKDGFAAIPDGMWVLMTGGYLGYVGGRSYDKKQLLNGGK